MSYVRPPVMRGFERLRMHIGTFLEQSLPPLIDVARQFWGIPAFSLP